MIWHLVMINSRQLTKTFPVSLPCYVLLPAKFGADKAKILVESVKNLVRSSENACCLHYTADFEVLLNAEKELGEKTPELRFR